MRGGNRKRQCVRLLTWMGKGGIIPQTWKGAKLRMKDLEFVLRYLEV